MPLSLGYCELYNPILHGRIFDASTQLDTRYIVGYLFTCEEFLADEFIEPINVAKRIYSRISPRAKHPCIRNYAKICKAPNYIQLHLLDTHEIRCNITDREWSTCQIKTHLIIRIQRLWRAFLIKRKSLLNRYGNIRALRAREIKGKV